MTTWAVEIDHDGGQREGRLMSYLVIDDETDDLLGTVTGYGYVYRFTARRMEPGDLARLAFHRAGDGYPGDVPPGPPVPGR